jgi:AraC family transcriptional regulator
MSIKEEPKSASIETPLAGNSRPGIVPSPEIHDSRVQIVIEFMAANLHRRISSADFGREVRLSPTQVNRLFTKETGITPGEYLIRLRMERAAQLLLNGLLSVKEVMAMCGYGNRGHFVQHFKRYLGVAPSHYRKKVGSS